MKSKIIFIALIVGIILCSLSAINAADNDISLNQPIQADLVGVSDYSVNNDNMGQSSQNEIIKIAEGGVNTTKQSTKINASNIDLYCRNGTRFYATLLDENNNPLANQTLLFVINGVSYNRTTNVNGSTSVPINLNPGKFLISVSFDGTELYEGCEIGAYATVLPTISGENVTKYFRNETQYYATFLDGQGNPLANERIYFNINGVFYYRTTNASGMAKLDINLPAGEYILTAVQESNNFTYSNIVKVLPTIEGMNLTKAFQDNHHYQAKFLDGNGNPLVGGNVSFNINGIFYYRVTDANGMAKLNINLPAGEYILTAYNSNDEFRLSNKIVILKDVGTELKVKNVTLMEDEKQLVYATLYDQLGYTVPNKTLTLMVDDEVIEAVTNNNGVACFELLLPSDTYYVYYQFLGDDVYAPCGVEGIITVEDGILVSYDIPDTIIFNGNKFNIYVKDLNGTPLENLCVVFTVNNINYKRTTNSEGYAGLNINLVPGKNTIYYAINTTGYSTKQSSTNITVITTNSTNFSTSTEVVYVNSGQKFDVTLSAGDVPLPNQVIYITLNGEVYKRTTNDDGAAYVNINLPVGKYTITASFNGTSKLKSNSKKFTLEVLNLIETEFDYPGSYDIVSGNYFYVILEDIDGNPVANKNVTITISGVNYVRTTDGDGFVSVQINLPAGDYTIYYKFDGEAPYAGCDGSTDIRVISNIINGNGYWVFGRDMAKVDLNSLAEQGTGNIFLNYYAFSEQGEANVVAWIKKANSLGIKVHIWMQSFYNGDFISPVLSDGTPNYSLFNEKVEEAKRYAKTEGVSGIHLDYLRFPGTAFKHEKGTEAINEFVRMVDEAITAINPNIILSAAVMPETTSNVYYYGQDVSVLGKYVDVIIPMVYKGNYKSGDAWITSTTKWFVDNSNGAQVWTGLQAYKSDSDVTPLSVAELTEDAKAAIKGGAVGVVMFRWGVTNFIDFNSIIKPSPSPVPSGTVFKAADIRAAAKVVKESMENNGVLPNVVSVGGVDCSVAQFLYLLVQYTSNYKQAEFSVIDLAEPEPYVGGSIRAKLNKDEFVKIADNIINYCKSNGGAPAYASSSIGNLDYSTLVYSYAKIVNFMSSNSVLPAFVYVVNIVKDYSITVTMMPSVATTQYKYIKYITTWLSYCPKCGYHGTLLDNPKHVYEGELTCSYCDADYCGVTGKDKLLSSNIYLTRLTESIPEGEQPVVSGDVSIKDIAQAAIYIRGYYEANGELPTYVDINGKQFTSAQYLYLVSKAIVGVDSSQLSDIKVIEVDNPSNPIGNVISSSLTKTQYMDVVTRVAKFIEQYGQAPNYASSDVGKIIYIELVDSFSRILAYYAENNALPTTVAIKYGGGTTDSIANLAKSLTSGLTSERDKAVALYNYVRDYINYQFYYNTQKGAQGTLTSGSGNCCDQAQLLVAMARSVNLTVRFATGNCRFTSGSTYGHVWVQFNIGGSWINADPTSTRNSFGVINNWDTKNYVNRGTYDVLPY